MKGSSILRGKNNKGALFAASCVTECHKSAVEDYKEGMSRLLPFVSPEHTYVAMWTLSLYYHKKKNITLGGHTFFE